MYKFLKEHKQQFFLCLIILLTIVTRLIDLGVLPNGFHQDEAFVVLNAYDLYCEGRDSGGHLWPVYMSSWGDGQSAMYIWLLLPLMWITKGSISLWVVRIPQMIVSVLSVAAVYGIVKRLGNSSNKGLLAAGMLAICPWHYMMARWGLDANMAPGFIIFALYFFVLGLEKDKYLLLSAFFYALTLYCYAVTWPIVPFIILCEIVYGFMAKKLKFNLTLVLSAVILVVTAMPVFLYFLVNQGYIDEINLPFMSIYRSYHFRSDELTLSVNNIIINLKTFARLLIFNDTGDPWSTIKPFGLFYIPGLIFMVIGAAFWVINLVIKLRKKAQIDAEIILGIQLVGGLLVAAFVRPRFHQTNIIYIPLVILEAYGIWNTIEIVVKLSRDAGKKVGIVVWSTTILAYAVMFVLFLANYFGPYRKLVNAYFCEDAQECVEYAVGVCEENDIHMITAEKGMQWPRLLLFTKTTPGEYYSENLIYDEEPAPWSYSNGDLTVQTRIDYKNITTESVYILYYTDVDIFSEQFSLVAFGDWYVAVPK